MMKKITALFLLMLFSSIFVFAAPKKAVTIKLASIAPENSPWGKALNKMAADWKSISGGEVNMIVYHNGTQGGEQDVLRKLKQNQIQAAVFTSIGMSSISSEIMTVSAPFLIRTDDEFNYVVDKLNPLLESKLTSQGFYPVAWSKAGWVRIFARHPVFVPSDLRKQKMGFSAELPSLNDTFKSMGYNLIPVGITDTLMMLNAGSIDAILQSPIYAGALQLFASAKNMADFKVAPFLGAILLNEDAWRKINGKKYTAKLLEASRKIGADNDEATITLEDNAIVEMKKYGLVINTPTPENLQEWYNDVNRALPSILGKNFDRDIYQQVENLLKTKRGN
ncbi:hypothetical protein FACS189494_02820 [Spirochaetia bacterium]|nr:hypothetical protein FACS189494_02820 [Spirochaetia bacterium]